MDYGTLKRWADQESMVQHAIAFALVDIAENLNEIRQALTAEEE